MINRVHNAQMYACKFDTKVKFQEAAQSCVRQWNIFLLSLIHPDPAFFIGWKLICVLFISVFWAEYLDNILLFH